MLKKKKDTQKEKKYERSWQEKKYSKENHGGGLC